MKSDLHPGWHCAALAALFALTACGETKQPAVQATAGGEVLEGSVSDAMLPVDRVRSQPPLAPKGDDSGGDGKTEAKAGGGAKHSAAAAPSEAPAEAAPAADAGTSNDAPKESRPAAE